MNVASAIKDLFLLVADKNTAMGLNGLLNRHQALGIRPISYDCYIHPQRDPGCLLYSSDFLRSFINSYRYAIVIFDHEGYGQDEKPREVLEAEVEKKLEQNGWANRSTAIIIYPELESWVWTRSSHLEEALGWSGHVPDLRTWLQSQGLIEGYYDKPVRPKEAMEKALRIVKKPRSSSLYLELAQKVSLEGHNNPSFLKLKMRLQKWFPR